ncbi:NAD(P)-binding protein [Lophiostoma macrostomum CBS 122681]|uniref:NAD(P)-binding protein n=1 Tax=Lophiostoma macrostomum CBS 122681 TaxID=1314788 RepID=A0A6A6TDK3_9PLEO|nr:NAD(P)-binding protein [Lophiostoma macrostomum CBS 122681]
MKLVVTGATGFVGQEVIRLALQNRAITSTIALARSNVSVPENGGPDADTSKLKSVVLTDWENPYPEHVIEQLKGADACVWTLAITPKKSKGLEFEAVMKVCHDYTIKGLNQIASVANKPFRFIYTSGAPAERDQTKIPPFHPDYCLMRGRVENAVLDLATRLAPAVEVAIIRSGCVEGPGHPKTEAVTRIWEHYGPTPWVHVTELAATMIEQGLHGINMNTLYANDIEEIRSSVLKTEEPVSLE